MIPGVALQPIEPISDERGRFAEIYRASPDGARFVQANHSRSAAGVVRGLHYHRAQADLWYVVAGTARVALVDLRERRDPPGIDVLELSGDAPTTLYIPPGIAHGFAALTDLDLIYWVTELYDGSDEFGVAWDDPALGIDWGVADPRISQRDATNPPLSWDQVPAFS